MLRRLVLISSLYSATAWSAGPAPLELDLPLLDLPYNTSAGYTAPSMRQALLITKDFYQYAHHALGARFESRPVAQTWAIIGFDFLFTWLPPGDSWLHEEWHRAVLGRYGIDSYNEVYELPLLAETIAVSHVRDADLEELKRDHPADFVRLSAAGLEAQIEFVTALEKDAFFAHVRNRNGFLMWVNLVNAVGYLDTCAGPEANELTAEAYRDEGARISARDFTGLDCNAWVYDLFRPDEPYAARGTHPSGVGYDRYIDWDDLTARERDYLKRQRNLALLNFFDPFLFGARDGFYTHDWHWNANLRHFLTASGYATDANLFLSGAALDALVTLRIYRNYNHAFPGLSIEWRRLPLRLGDLPTRFSLVTALWQQPEDQDFYTADAAPGGQLALRADHPLRTPWGAYAEVDRKTSGWVPGNVYLDDNTSVRLGITARW